MHGGLDVTTVEALFDLGFDCSSSKQGVSERLAFVRKAEFAQSKRFFA